ncbi:hypothetical protein M4A92_18705, partial [Caldibacillus thermoamylovorans]|uniref:hypothetical protein n=1 Tax=Caldibacillus thermoamylovorans TaxID=35841 RepID=UPI00203B4DEF
FYRLTARLKDTFKKLPICLIADSLYACENVLKQCKANNWNYLGVAEQTKKPNRRRIYELFVEYKV